MDIFSDFSIHDISIARGSKPFVVGTVGFKFPEVLPDGGEVKQVVRITTRILYDRGMSIEDVQQALLDRAKQAMIQAVTKAESASAHDLLETAAKESEAVLT